MSSSSSAVMDRAMAGRRAQFVSELIALSHCEASSLTIDHHRRASKSRARAILERDLSPDRIQYRTLRPASRPVPSLLVPSLPYPALKLPAPSYRYIHADVLLPLRTAWLNCPLYNSACTSNPVKTRQVSVMVSSC